MKKVKQRYFDRAYWEDGTKSGYTTTTYNRQDYLNEAKAVFLAELYGIDGKWLEVGCAFGWVVERLRELGVDCYGFDISKHSVKHSSVASVLQCSDGLSSKLYKPDTFDVIFSFETAEHVYVDDVDTWLRNIYNWLKPGGKLFMTICLGHDNMRGINDNDQSHQTLQPREWWESKFESFGLQRHDIAFADATEIIVNTEEMQIRGKPENLITEYGLRHFCYVEV